MDGNEEQRVFLGLGSNLGDRRGNLLEALRLLDAMEDVRVLEVSSVYEAEPWGVLEQPDFLNLVAELATTRTPRGMLAACAEVEEKLGRIRGQRWGPRVIDVDILLYDDIKLEDEDLIIPHPHMLERDFVMVPLLELRPDMELAGERGEDLRPRQGDRQTARAVFRYDKEEWHG
jgi:2-amino-4-hydroxy-6-hydroxymethyldihydropteridine diphosphokinase